MLAHIGISWYNILPIRRTNMTEWQGRKLMNEINSIGNARSIIREISKVIVGKDEILIKVLLAVISKGHVLMEDIPGVGKTTMAISLSKALGLDYNRV